MRRTRHFFRLFSSGGSPAIPPPMSFSLEKMSRDARYQPTSELPASLAVSAGGALFSPGMAIKGEALAGRPVYLDLQATTPLDPRVLDAMMPYFLHSFGNPHSRTHAYGWESEAAIEHARAQVASLLGADAKEIIFTSGATESNNMAIKGVAQFYKSSKRHIVTTPTEHKCVLDSCRWLETQGWSTTYVPVRSNGLVDVGDLEAAIRPDTALVSVMGVNNEIGVIQPLADIGALCRRKRVFFHTDAAQMVGKVPIDVEAMNIDLLSLSGHKIYGPKGVGALYVRRRPRVRMEPLMSGGGQERGLRSGTIPHPLVAGLGAACALAQEEMPRDAAWVDALSRRLYAAITSQLTHVTLNGDEKARYPGNLNLSFACVEGESLLMALKNVAVSSGSACTSASLEPSYGAFPRFFAHAHTRGKARAMLRPFPKIISLLTHPSQQTPLPNPLLPSPPPPPPTK
jgi:cysteine desulfurase